MTRAVAPDVEVERRCAGVCGRMVARGRRRLKDSWYCLEPRCQDVRQAAACTRARRKAGVPARVETVCVGCSKPLWVNPTQVGPLGSWCPRKACHAAYQRRRHALLHPARSAETCDHCAGPYRPGRPGPVGRYGRLCSKPACRAEYTRRWTADRKTSVAA